MFKRKLYLVIFMILLSSCARGPIQSTSQAMRAFNGDIELFDDLGGEGMLEALEANIQALKAKNKPNRIMKFGPREIKISVYIRALERLVSKFPTGRKLKNITGGISAEQHWKDYLKSHFDLYEVYGQRRWGEVFMTSYYEPVIPGSLRKTKRFSRALYRVPKDMVRVSIGEFSKVNSRLRKLYEGVMEQKSPSPILRGRLIKRKTGSANYIVKPYFDRREIDEKNLLKGRRLEIVWVDPVEAFFLQIQGSGVVHLKNGREIRVGYASQNGHPYVAIGKFLFDRIPKEKMSLQTIEAELRKMPEKEMQELLNRNPSYVFFRKLKGGAVGYLGAEVVPGRTIATDTRYFPKGALAFLQFEKPIFKNSSSVEPESWRKTSRFVFDQDTGGAIRGPGRLDLFWGKGSRARQVAGVMKNYGSLKYLVPSEKLIGELSQNKAIAR